MNRNTNISPLCKSNFPVERFFDFCRFSYFRDRREQIVFQELLKACPTLEERLRVATDDEVIAIAELVRSQASTLSWRYHSRSSRYLDPQGCYQCQNR
jgi:hypothetical protein